MASIILPLVPVPETTSAEGFERYVGGKCLHDSHGEAWREIKAWIVALPPVVDVLHLPSLAWNRYPERLEQMTGR